MVIVNGEDLDTVVGDCANLGAGVSEEGDHVNLLNTKGGAVDSLSIWVKKDLNYFVRSPR